VIPIVVLLVSSFLIFLRFHHQWDLVNSPFATPPPVEIVVASLKSEDTAWVAQYLPHWFRSIYVVDEPAAKLTVPRNKGREAMVYLTHIINNYDTLAETTVFVHASRFAWHNDDPDYDALGSLSHLQLDYVQAAGYVNLRCVLILGCPIEIRPHADAASAEERANNNGVSSVSGQALTAKQIYKQAFEELMPGADVPQEVGVSCCSQFAVSREAVYRHPRANYVRWREWLLETPLADDLSGRVFEYMWHSECSRFFSLPVGAGLVVLTLLMSGQVIFGKKAVFCPSPAECYCKVYGLCNLSCNGMECSGRYVFPKYSTLPNGWPRVGWSGEERAFSGPL
jgi:hypothetical protein